MLLRASFSTLILLVLTAGLGFAQAEVPFTTLRSQGAVGDGTTDDRAAIEAALRTADGAPVDGEGLTYAVHGNIDLRNSIDLRNTTFVQTMGPPDTTRFLTTTGEFTVDPPDALRHEAEGMPVLHPSGVGTYSGDPIPTEEDLEALLPSIVLRTLSIVGDNNALISVHLRNVRVDRGDHPDSGGRNDGAGIRIAWASPVVLEDVEVFGDGKGTGIGVANCKQVSLERVHIHDMTWAPYEGDDVLEKLTADLVRDQFGWNNFPIYEYRAGMKQFARVRVQEQLSGMFVMLSDDVRILDTKVENLGVLIGGERYYIQADGLTVGRVTNLVIRDSEFNRAWEGIDFTSGSGSDFVIENCRVADIHGWGFKLAHPKQNGRLINCIAERSGISGFIVGGKSENIELIDCQALENGARGLWTKGDGTRIMATSGFRLENDEPDAEYPHTIRLDRCSAINNDSANAMDYGVLCQANKPQERNISVGSVVVVGAQKEAVHGIEAERLIAP